MNNEKAALAQGIPAGMIEAYKARVDKYMSTLICPLDINNRCIGIRCEYYPQFPTEECMVNVAKRYEVEGK